MATLDDIISAVKNLSQQKGINELEIKDALMSALKTVHKKIVYFNDDGELVFGDGTLVPKKNIRSIERKLVYNISRLVAHKKYAHLKMILKAQENTITGLVLGYSSKECVLSWEGMLFVVDSSNFWIHRRKPTAGQTVRFFVQKTVLDIKQVERPILLEITVRNKKFLQHEIADWLGVSKEFIEVKIIDVKKVHIRLKCKLDSAINEKIITSPYRLCVNAD